jgi:hypothetical protein
MSSTPESDTFTSRSSDASIECKPLLDATTKDLFRKNAFRITGLPVDATARDIGKHAEKLQLIAELGQDPQLNAAFPLRPPPTVEDIREAIQRLKDPEKRLIDEFFWFWPESFGESRLDAAFQALERGDFEDAANNLDVQTQASNRRNCRETQPSPELSYLGTRLGSLFPQYRN